MTNRVPDAVPHVEMELGLYALGALGRDEAALVEKHLHGCPLCTDAYDLIRDIPTLLARQSPDDVAHLLATTGGHVGNGKRTLNRDARPAGAGPRSGTIRRSRTLAGWPLRSRLVLVAAAVVLLAGIGAVIARLLPQDTPPGPSLVVINASEPANGIKATVTVTAATPGSTVEVLVQGLTSGTRYTLTAVTRDGRTLSVLAWVATGADQTVDGLVPAAMGELAFFAVTGPDGVVLTVPFAAVATRT